MSGKTLITGGLGYVGGRVALELFKDKALTLRLGTRRSPSELPSWVKGIKTVPLDISSDESVEQACKGVRTIVHLAAMNENECVKDPQAALAVNTAGTLRVLQCGQAAGVERFIYLSTAHVYASPLAGVITEESVPRPIHPYAITHKAAEDFVLAAHDTRKLTGIVLRLSNGFGAPADPDVDRWTLLVNDLARQAVLTRKLVLRSSGLSQRDFITLEDVCAAMVHFIALPARNCGNGLFNLGGEASMSVLAMAERISGRCEAVLGFRPVIERPAPSAQESSGEGQGALDYRIDKLKSTGFMLKGRFDEELDATLRLCKAAFGRGA